MTTMPRRTANRTVRHGVLTMPTMLFEKRYRRQYFTPSSVAVGLLALSTSFVLRWGLKGVGLLQQNLTHGKVAMRNTSRTVRHGVLTMPSLHIEN